MKTFRSFNLNPSKYNVKSQYRSGLIVPLGIKIIGFKDINTLPFDANVKHAVFLHPNEAVCLI
jgi:hypothetical protein